MEVIVHVKRVCRELRIRRNFHVGDAGSCRVGTYARIRSVGERFRCREIHESTQLTMSVVDSGVENRNTRGVESFLAGGPRLVGADDLHVPLCSVGKIGRVGWVVRWKRENILRLTRTHAVLRQPADVSVVADGRDKITRTQGGYRGERKSADERNSDVIPSLGDDAPERVDESEARRRNRRRVLEDYDSFSRVRSARDARVRYRRCDFFRTGW